MENTAQDIMPKSKPANLERILSAIEDTNPSLIPFRSVYYNHHDYIGERKRINAEDRQKAKLVLYDSVAKLAKKGNTNQQIAEALTQKLKVTVDEKAVKKIQKDYSGFYFDMLVSGIIRQNASQDIVLSEIEKRAKSKLFDTVTGMYKCSFSDSEISEVMDSFYPNIKTVLQGKKSSRVYSIPFDATLLDFIRKTAHKSAETKEERQKWVYITKSKGLSSIVRQEAFIDGTKDYIDKKLEFAKEVSGFLAASDDIESAVSHLNLLYKREDINASMVKKLKRYNEVIQNLDAIAGKLPQISSQNLYNSNLMTLAKIAYEKYASLRDSYKSQNKEFTSKSINKEVAEYLSKLDLAPKDFKFELDYVIALKEFYTKRHSYEKPLIQQDKKEPIAESTEAAHLITAPKPSIEPKFESKLEQLNPKVQYENFYSPVERFFFSLSRQKQSRIDMLTELNDLESGNAENLYCKPAYARYDSKFLPPSKRYYNARGWSNPLVRINFVNFIFNRLIERVQESRLFDYFYNPDCQTIK